MKGVIFDRDGTLIKYKPYLNKVDEVELITWCSRGYKKIERSGYLIFLHTINLVLTEGTTQWTMY